MTRVLRNNDDLVNVFCFSGLFTILGFIGTVDQYNKQHSMGGSYFPALLVITIVSGSIMGISGYFLYRRGRRKKVSRGWRKKVSRWWRKKVSRVHLAAQEYTRDEKLFKVVWDELLDAISSLGQDVSEQYSKLRLTYLTYLGCCLQFSEFMDVSGTEVDLVRIANKIMEVTKNEFPKDPAEWTIHKQFRNVTFRRYLDETIDPESSWHPWIQAEKQRVAALRIYKDETGKI